MGTLYISEYKVMLIMGVPGEAVCNQTLTIDLMSRRSVPFQAGTKFIRLHADEDCSVRFGISPTAEATDAHVPAGVTEYFSVKEGEQVAVISMGKQTQSGTDSLEALLKVVSDPRAARAHLNDIATEQLALNKMRAEIQAAQAVLKTSHESLAEREKAVGFREAAQEARERDSLSRERASQEQQKSLTRGAAELASKQMDFNARMKEGADSLAAREQALVVLERAAQDVIQREQALKAAEADYKQRVTRLKELAA